MINIHHLADNSELNKLEYFNTIGLIFQNEIYLNRNDVLLKYDVDEIKRVAFKKQRSLNRNYFTLFLSLLIVFFTCALGNILGNFKLFGFLISGSLLLYSFLNKSYSYQIFLITVNQNIVSLAINPDIKMEAFKLVALINKKIKNEAQYLKVS